MSAGPQAAPEAPIGTPSPGGGTVIRSARYQALLRRTAPAGTASHGPRSVADRHELMR